MKVESWECSMYSGPEIIECGDRFHTQLLVSTRTRQESGTTLPMMSCISCVPMLQVLKKDRIPTETDIQRPRNFFARCECVNRRFSSWFGQRQESGLYDTLDAGCFMAVPGNIGVCHFSPCKMCQNSITLFHLDTRTTEKYRILSVKMLERTGYF